MKTTNARRRVCSGSWNCYVRMFGDGKKARRKRNEARRLLVLLIRSLVTEEKAGIV